MLVDRFSYLMKKFAEVAQNEISERNRLELRHRERRETFCRIQRIAKRCLLAIAAVGIGAALYFARDLGGLAAETMSARQPEPSIQTPEKSVAKRLRHMAEARQQRDEELKEIEGF